MSAGYNMEQVRGEILLRFTPEILLSDLERGSALARALGGRLARAYAGYNLTPSASRKWVVLFGAGFTAYRRQLHGSDLVWRFGRNDGECLRLAEAMKASHTKEAVCQR